MKIVGIKYVVRANLQTIHQNEVTGINGVKEFIVKLPLMKMSEFVKENGKITDLDVSFIPIYEKEDNNIMHVPNINDLGRSEK
jgi:hypothetical protein